MDTSLDYQIDLVEKFKVQLLYHSSRMSETIVKYQKYIQVLEEEGLMKEAVKNLEEKYFVDTQRVIMGIQNHIHEQDIPFSNLIIQELEEMKNTATK